DPGSNTMHVKLVAIVAGIVTLFAVARADDPPAAKEPESLNDFIGKTVVPLIKDDAGVGVVVGVWKGGEAESKPQVFGFGKVKLDEEEVTPDGDTMFEIASMTKAFTGTLLAQLVLSGTVKLDDHVQKYLPDDLQMPRRDDRDI